MRFKNKTIEAMKDLADNDKYGHFFDGLKHTATGDDDALIERLAELLIVECEIDWDELEKVKFFMGLSSKACGNKE